MSVNNDRYSDILTSLCGYARRDDDIRAVIAIGSSVRESTPADEYSDLDLIVVTELPETWYSGEYPALFGEVFISFIEPTLGGGMERRCIYSGGRDADMIILTPSQFGSALDEGSAALVMERGYCLLCDKEGYSGKIPQYLSCEVRGDIMGEAEFANTANDFFFHNIWACKKLLRGELWSAKMCIDGYLKERLLKMIAQYELCVSAKDTWHDGRFLDSWAEGFITESLKDCFARYDARDCKRALAATHLLFARLAVRAADSRGYSYPMAAQKCAAEYLEEHGISLEGIK